jgi:O-antigen/teichoic acid export membrane protein
MLQLLRNALRFAGVDWPVFYAASGRVWSVFSGPVSIYLIARSFSPADQGYYYTFGSIVALQIFFELGFSQCTSLFASHEFSRLTLRPDGSLAGEAAAQSRLASLTRLSLRWFAVLSLLFLAGVGLGGHLFFHLTAASTHWMGPWWCLCLATAVTLLLVPYWALLEGCNQLRFVFGFRTCSSMLQAVVLWVALLGGAGLYACALMVGAAALASFLTLVWKWRPFFSLLLQTPLQETVSWKQEMWPFQWRTAVNWVSGYFAYNFLTPVVFQLQGPAVAGRLGMTLQVVNALQAVAVSWTSSKMPRFAMLIAQRQFAELDHIFRRATAQAVGMAVAGGGVLMLAVWWLQTYYPFLGSRFLGLGCLAVLSISAVTSQLTLAISFYTRAHKIDPFVPLAVTNGLVTGAAVLWLVKDFGVLGGCLTYTGVQVLLLPWVVSVWRRCKRAWHAPV